MKKLLKKKKLSEVGASLVEYGLLVALISVIAIAAIRAAGENINQTFKEAKKGLISGAAQQPSGGGPGTTDE